MMTMMTGHFGFATRNDVKDAMFSRSQMYDDRGFGGSNRPMHTRRSLHKRATNHDVAGHFRSWTRSLEVNVNFCASQFFTQRFSFCEKRRASAIA